MGVDVGYIGYIFPSQGGPILGGMTGPHKQKRLKSGIFHLERMVQRYFRCNEPSKNSAASGTPQISWSMRWDAVRQTRHVLLL